MADALSLEALIAEAVRSVVREEVAPLRAELARLRRREEEEGVTEQEASRRLHVSVRTIQRWIRDGQLEAIKVSGVRRVLLSGVLARSEDATDDITPIRGP